jgi:hypothetical protein
MMNIDVRSVFRPWKGCCVFLAALGVAALFSPPSYAQRVSSADRLNGNTLTVVSISPNGIDMPVAHDMSAVFDASLRPGERDRLFREFPPWSKTRERR